ncbi:hypothetical protein [Parasynechococcus sp.]|uniref:hypothetical protein n=1 Tax=Parasynechococcus sp. TaxID=3101203 RepID=UPI003704C89D
MDRQSEGPTCFLRWTVQKVAHQLYAVAATNNGCDYDFVGNFGTLSEANRAGRQYICDRQHALLKRNTLEMEAA